MELMHYAPDSETPRGAPLYDSLMRQVLGLDDPPPNSRTPMKIISWNYQGARKRVFSVHCLRLKLSHHPHVMVIMETRVSNRWAHRIIPTLGFPNYFCVPSVEFAGGLWVLWDSAQVHIEILAFSTQAVHALVSFNQVCEWAFTVAYSSLVPEQRRLFWDSFHTISHHMTLSWLVAGDFNDVVTSLEKFAGADFRYNRASPFNHCVDECNLLDLGFQGSSFTWCGKRHGGRMVYKRLDRALCADAWRLAFPEATVFHLPRVFF